MWLSAVAGAAGNASGESGRCGFRGFRAVSGCWAGSFPAGIWRRGGDGEVLGDGEAGPGGRERGPGRGGGGGGGSARRSSSPGWRPGRRTRPGSAITGGGEGDRGGGAGAAAAVAEAAFESTVPASSGAAQVTSAAVIRHGTVEGGARPGRDQRVRAGPRHPAGLPEPARATCTRPTPGRSCPMTRTPSGCGPGGLPPGGGRAAGPGGHRGPDPRHGRPRPAHRPRG